MKILVVDDHPLILEALHHVLRQLDREVEVYDARTGAEGRKLVAAHPETGLLLLDLTLPDIDGLALLSELRHDFPAIPVVVLSASDRREDVLRAIDLGAMGFIPKTSSNQVMLQALRLVLSGGVYLPPAALVHQEGADIEAAAGSAPDPVGATATRVTPRELGLTGRQAQVLALILQGKPNKVICRELGLAEGTVKIHVAAILRALNVSTRTQAVIEASRLGLHLEAQAAITAAEQLRQ
ncbi:MAG TPA: response regulator transcription factor [Burkholderiales bacterium]|nr:response regulator transcription factor [Burkholderiales bacterium]